jgi:hypothetical protein
MLIKKDAMSKFFIFYFSSGAPGHNHDLPRDYSEECARLPAKVLSGAREFLELLSRIANSWGQNGRMAVKEER